MKYNVTVWMRDTEDQCDLTMKGEVEFAHKDGDYGNGYHMGVSGLGEPFPCGYDIRYDDDFNEDNPMQYIANFYLGKKYRSGVKVTGIQITESEDKG